MRATATAQGRSLCHGRQMNCQQCPGTRPWLRDVPVPFCRCVVAAAASSLLLCCPMHTGAPHNIDETWAIYTGINPQCSPWGSANRRGAEFGTMQDCTTRCDHQMMLLLQRHTHCLVVLCCQHLHDSTVTTSGDWQGTAPSFCWRCPLPVLERPAPQCKPQFDFGSVTPTTPPCSPV